MKKKIVALLLTLVMLVGIIPAAVYAAEEAETKVTLEVVADKATAMPGDEITYTVTMKTEYALTAMGFITNFPEGLTYVDGSGAVNPEAKATLGCDDYEWVEWTKRTGMGAQKGENKLQGIASSPNQVSEIVLCTFKAKVDDDAALTDGYEVALVELVEFMDSDCNAMTEEEIEVIDGYYSVEDTAGELLANEECLKIVKGWYMQMGNLTFASMLTTVRDMMGFKKITEFTSISGDVPLKDVARLNRMLNKVKK